MGYWKKHPKKEGEQTLKEFDRHRYRIENPPKYYTVLCPCGDHLRQVHISPSNPNHFRECLNWARRLPCWDPERRDR